MALAFAHHDSPLLLVLIFLHAYEAMSYNSRKCISELSWLLVVVTVSEDVVDSSQIRRVEMGFL